MYLQARASNASPYPFLASDKASIFINGCFVTKTALKHTSPKETFNVFLGVDSAIKLQHKLISKAKKQGEEKKLFGKKQLSRQTFE